MGGDAAVDSEALNAVVAVGDEAPDFTLKNQFGEDVTLSSLRGSKAIVLMFYPFAFSRICTAELCEIRDKMPLTAGAASDADAVEVLAVSCDHMFSLRAYAEQDSLEFSLLSDFWPHGAVAASYGIFNESAGAANRGTYIIDHDGIVRWKVERGIGEGRDFADYPAALKNL